MILGSHNMQFANFYRVYNVYIVMYTITLRMQARNDTIKTSQNAYDRRKVLQEIRMSNKEVLKE